MRYWLNVYRHGFVYMALRFYTAWAGCGRTVLNCIWTDLNDQSGHQCAFSALQDANSTDYRNCRHYNLVNNTILHSLDPPNQKER
jgi:hypothetical protein